VSRFGRLGGVLLQQPQARSFSPVGQGFPPASFGFTVRSRADWGIVVASRKIHAVRMVTLCVVLAVGAAACGWATSRQGPERTGYNATEPAITPATVGSLTEIWRGELGGALGLASPVVANGNVYVGAFAGGLQVFTAAGCGSATCEPVWTGATPGGFLAPVPGVTVGRIQRAATVSGGVAYVVPDNQTLYAFDAAGVEGCSGVPKVCTALWTAPLLGLDGEPAEDGDQGDSPAVVGGRVYVTAGDGSLQVFDAAGSTGCAGTPKVCTPLWSGDLGGGPSGSAAVSGGKVYVNGGTALAAFDALGVTGCSGTPVVCSPLWTAPHAASGVETTPAVSGNRVYVRPRGFRLEVFDANGTQGCSGTPAVCTPLWQSEDINFMQTNSSPAVTGGSVYIAGTTFSGPDGIWAYSTNGTTGCSGTPKVCEPIWQHLTSGGLTWTSPAVANGVLFLGGPVSAVDAAGQVNCAPSPVFGRVCDRIWELTAENTSPYGPGDLEADIAVADGRVFVNDPSGALHVYAQPPT
jgi:outer membrane protein assembly factor BamB